jgi:alpha-1,2-mannosyltransferase
VPTRRQWVLAAIVLVASVALMLFITVGTTGPMIDVDVYLLAGQGFFHGVDLYRDGFGSTLATPLPYTYPPVWAAVVSTVAWLPWRSVAWGWTLLNVALLVWLVRTSYRRLLDRAGTWMPLALAALVAITAFTAPVMGTFDVGQVGLFLTVLVLADVLQARARVAQGVLVGVAAAIKLTPGLFCVYLAATRRRRAAAIAAGTAVGLWLVTAALRPDLSTTYWLRIAFRGDRTTEDLGIGINQSIEGALQRVGWTSLIPYLAATGLVLVVALRRSRSAHLAGDELAAATMIGLATLLISPVSWIHHAIWIVPASGVVLGDGRARGRQVAWAAVTVMFLLRIPLWSWSGALPTAWLTAPLLDNAYVWTYLVLLLALPITPARAPGEAGTEQAAVAATVRG